MSYCVQEKGGKDRVIFATEEDLSGTPKVNLSVTIDPADEVPNGPVLPNGEINWSCPCMGSVVSGPCGFEFRSAFSCFHYSQAEPRGSDCVDKFRDMSICMQKYPNLYGKEEENEDEEESDADPMAVASGSGPSGLDDAATQGAMGGPHHRPRSPPAELHSGKEGKSGAK